MIYEVYLDGNLLYYPNDETYAILNSTLQLALNEAGSFEFDIPTYNLRYNDFKLRKSMIQVLQNGEEIFYGEVREVKVNADFTKHVYAVGELAFLFDSIQPQGRYLTSPLDAVTEIIAKHNAQVEDRKKFKISHIDVTDNDNQIYFYTNGEDTLSIIRQKICDVLDGYIHITKDTSGERYISIVPLSYFGQCTQEIQFGENLLDYSCNMSASDIATCVVPRGVKLEETQRTADAVEGLDEYLTIKGTTADYYHKNTDDIFVQLDEAIANFGYVRVLKTWDDVTIAENLKTKAIEWLKSAQYEAMMLELKALDMAQFDVNIDTFNLGNSVRIWALPYGMDTRLPVRKKTIYLQDLQRNEVVLGNTVRQSFTSQASGAVEQLKQEIPEETNMLEQSMASAMAMLNDPSKGYVTYVFDKDGNRTEIWISDNKDSTKATRKWVWNSSGLGYLYLENGEWKSDVAITMDGAIVADKITTGTMLADRIRGGILEVGGTKFAKDGIISVKNNQDSIIVTLDVNGLQMNSGSINLNNKFSVNSNGYMTSTSGKIGGFEIETDNLSIGDATLRRDRIGCGSAGYGIVNIVGNRSSDNARFGYIQLSNSGNSNACLAGIRIYGNGLVRKYGGDGSVSWERWLSNIPES